ncbi:MAG: hypothetical protein AAFZ07_04070 [Actinomycetota bacterium]
MKKRRKQRLSHPQASDFALPKGAYRLPTGGIMLKPTTKIHSNGSKARKITVQGLMRDQINVERLAKALIEVAREEQRTKTKSEATSTDSFPQDDEIPRAA